MLIIILLFILQAVDAQQNFIELKKNNKTIQTFWKGSIMSFRLQDKEWRYGKITSIQTDSVYIQPFIVQYTMMGTDTMWYNIDGYAKPDIKAIPKKGILIHYANGHYEVNRAAGHVHWYWIKSGYIFRLGAIAYAVTNLFNSIRMHNYSSTAGNLGIAATVYAGGWVLKKNYKYYWPIGKKYHLAIINL
jgi:hypothetical protein